MQNNYFVERLLMAPCVNVMEVKRIVYALLSEIASLWRKVYESIWKLFNIMDDVYLML